MAREAVRGWSDFSWFHKAPNRETQCMSTLQEYYRENYHLLNSFNGNKELKNKLEERLDFHSKKEKMKAQFPARTHPFDVYGHYGSHFDHRPTRRRYLAGPPFLED